MACSHATLDSMTHMLARRSPLGISERAAIQALPHRVQDYERNAFLAREGDHVSHCDMLLSGYAFSYRLTGDGARQILSIHIPGDLLNLQHGTEGYAPCYIQPLGPVSVAHIPRPALIAMATALPEFGMALWASVDANASILEERLLSLGRRDARSRIAHFICEFATRQEAAGLCAFPDYSWPLTQEQIADLSGLTSVHVNRVLQSLRSERLVRTDHRIMHVLDWAGLCSVADFSSSYLRFIPLAQSDERCQARPAEAAFQSLH